MSHEHFKENLVAIKAESQRKQMEKDLMYQDMISEGKQKQEDWKLKMGLYDLSQTTDILKDVEQEEKSFRTR
ncbi:MAG TPA: hypothetical protein IAC20_01165 [Candidatus Faecisoma merdavium]|nr:hypothetical protein [Candidatus Faecisoma merdavium]